MERPRTKQSSRGMVPVDAGEKERDHGPQALLVREDMEEMEQDGVWVFCGGEGIENVSILRGLRW